MVDKNFALGLSLLSDEQTEQLAMIYFSAKEFFNVDPLNGSPKKAKKIRWWMMKMLEDVEDYPSAVMRWIDRSRSDSEFFEFFNACYLRNEERLADRQRQFESTISVFSDDIRQSFDELFTGGLEYATQTEDTVSFVLYNGYAFRKTLVLHTGDGTPDISFGQCIVDRFQLFHDEHGHRLECVTTSFEDDSETPVAIPFTEATNRVEIFSAMRRPIISDPWDMLSVIAFDILEKSRLGEGYINDKEKALLPLLTELDLLSTFDQEKPYAFPLLKQYAEKHGKKRLASALEQLKAHHEPKNLVSLRRHLNRLSYEPLWREIYTLIAESQADYTESIIPKNRQADFEGMKKTIENYLHVLGYEGAYPSFRKVGPMRGLHLENSYDVSYWVGMTRSAEYRIDCTESFSGNSISIDFACGTAFPKAHETVEDIYSCCFNAGGRRLYKQTYYHESLDENTDLQTVVAAAAKRAECKKLTAAEKAADGVSEHPWRLFFLLFFVFGLMFAVGFTVLMFLFAFLLTWILDGAQAASVICDPIAWLFVFVVSFIGFGVPMALVTVKAGKKY